MESKKNDDDPVQLVRRRDEPVPPTWVVRGDEPATPWIGRPVPRRPMSGRRLLVVATLVFFLVVQVVGTVVTYLNASTGDLPLLLAGAVFTLVVEVVGWWVVYVLIARR